MFNSPLRYPGGKGRLTRFVANLIEVNELCGGHYVEPYAGGAGIAISLLYLEYVDKIHLNDLNRSVYAFWRSVLEQPDALCRLVSDTPITIDQWKRQKAIQLAREPSTLELGFSTFFLNRTNRSGIISAGVIGGKSQDGVWKLDARFNRRELRRRIEKIASYASRIRIYNLDAEDFIGNHFDSIPSSALIYLDPPYYVKGRQLYENHYDHHDHERIANLVGQIRQKWIVSYDNAEPIVRLYRRYRQRTFGLHYSAQERYRGTEVMVFCDGLIAPGAVEPWRGIAS